MVALPMPRRGTAAAPFELAFHFLDARSITAYNLFDMPYPIEVEFQFVQLAKKLVVPLDFGICSFNQVPGSIELGHGEHLALLAEVHDLLLDLAHDAIKIPS